MEYIRSGHYDIVRNDYGRQMVIPSEKEWVEVKRGRWVDDRCSECGQHNPVYKVTLRGETIWEIEGQSNFCPNCGAKMGKE